MSRSRTAQSQIRRLKRAPIKRYRYDAEGNFMGLTSKRKFPGGRISLHQPTMSVERTVDDVTGETEIVEVPLSKTVGYKRRVFADKDGNYPAGAYAFEMAISPYKTRSVMVVDDTKEVASKPTACPTNI